MYDLVAHTDFYGRFRDELPFVVGLDVDAKAQTPEARRVDAQCLAGQQVEADATARTLKVKRELEGGWFQWITLPMPALLTIQSGINQLRYATLKGIMAAKKKEVATIARESLGVAIEPTERIERIYVPVKTKKTEFITGTPKEAAAKLLEKLRHEARVL